MGKLKRYFLLLISLLVVSGIIVGCSSDDASTDTNEVADDSNNETEEVATENSSGGGDDPESLGIELRNHDYDETEEEIDRFIDYEDGYYAKDGENLTLPEEFPSDFPIAEGMTVEVVTVKDSLLEVWFNDHGNYTFEQLTALYDYYIESDAFDEGGFSEDSSLAAGLDAYIGMRDGHEYVIGVDNNYDHVIVTLSIYYD